MSAQCHGRGRAGLEGHCPCAMAPSWDFPGCLQICRDKCLATWAEHEKQQVGVNCKVSAPGMSYNIICETSSENLLDNHVLQTFSGFRQNRFFEMPQAKEPCQDKWEVLSILQSISISTSHPCWVPLAPASTQSLLSQLLRETLLILEMHGQETHFCKPGFQNHR